MKESSAPKLIEGKVAAIKQAKLALDMKSVSSGWKSSEKGECDWNAPKYTEGMQKKISSQDFYNFKIVDT